MDTSKHSIWHSFKSGDVESLQKYALATGVGIFGGSFAGFLAENLCNAKAIESNCVPALIALAAAFLLGYFLPAKKNILVGCAAPLLILLSVLAATLLRDSSPDGLGFHAEQIKRMIEAKNSHHAETEASKRNGGLLNLLNGQAEKKYYYASIFSRLTGNIESGKWLNIAWPIAGSLLMFAGMAHQTLPSLKLKAILGLILFQPVVIYQFNTLYQEGQLAGALTGFFGSVLLIFAQMSPVSLLACFLSLVCMATTKSFALGYMLIFSFILALCLLAKKRKIDFLPWAALLLIVSFFVSLLSPYLYSIRTNDNQQENKICGISLYKILFFINPVILDPNQKDGIHVGCGEPSHNAAVLFWRRHFVATKRADDISKIKPPFWFTRPELDVFSDLTPDLRLGGYGPLYGTAFLLALIPGAFLLVSRVPSLDGWRYILLACLVMVPITPSWWARWFPQGWWIPFAACVGFLYGQPDGLKKFRWVGCLAKGGILALVLNSFLILGFTVKGYAEAEAVIRQQLSFLGTRPQPLHIETGHYTGARHWIEQKKISYDLEEIPSYAASMTLYRTTLKIRLFNEDLEQIRRTPSFLELLKKHKLLNLPGV